MSEIAIPITPETQCVNNTKLQQVLPQIQGAHLIPQEERGPYIINQGDADTVTQFSLSASEPMDLSISNLDLAITDAVYTLYLAGAETVTPTQIVRTMSGNPSQAVSKAFQHKIMNRMDVLTKARITIDAAKEFQRYNRLQGKESKFSGSFLPLEKINTSYLNGRECMAYRIIEVPPHYAYAGSLRQIATVPSEWFLTQEHFNDTEEAMLIKRYVLRRVRLMLSSNRLKSTRLSLIWNGRKNAAGSQSRGLYAALGYVPDDSKRWRCKIRPRVAAVVVGTLQHLVDLDVIAGFSSYRQGHSSSRNLPVCGYEVILHGKEDAMNKK